jgi:AhpD family alkylhydroperoxidase
MEARFSFEKVSPAAYAAMVELEKFLAKAGVKKSLLELLKIRASQINGCGFCIDMHTRIARQLGETERRLYALSAWRETPFYSAEERAALAVTEALTQVARHQLPDEIYNEARRFFDETALTEIIMAIATINAWNRIAIATRWLPE